MWPCGTRYIGEFYQDLRSGHGKSINTDGSSYEGQWKNDKKNGAGTETQPDGTKITGLWAEDEYKNVPIVHSN